MHPQRLARAATQRRPRTGRLTRWLVPAVALLVATTLTACSPAARRIVAVFLDNGEPTALLHPCSDEPVEGLQVRDVTPEESTPTRTSVATTSSGASTSASPTPDLSLLRWDISSADDVPAPSQVTLLTPPDGWQVYTDSFRLLKEFREDRVYDVSTSVLGDMGVEFTLDDLDGLETGQVWATPDDTRTPRAMSRDEFARIAEESCD